MSDETETTNASEVTETPAEPAEAVETDVDAFERGAVEVTEPKAEAKPVEAKPAEATPAEPAKPDAPAEPTPEAKAAAEAKTAEDAEIKALGIKGEKTAARFRELNAEARKVPELSKQVETMRPMVEQAERINAIFADTKANPDQIGSMLKYLKGINSGDRQAMEQCADTLIKEAQALCKFLGRELPAFNPIAEHADLNEAVDGGVMPAAQAKELAQARARQKQEETRQAAEAQDKRRADEQKKTTDDAVSAMNELGDKLRASDPHYTAKCEALKSSGTFELIKDTVHPSKWVNAFQLAYAKIPNPAPRAPVSAMPMRPTGADSNAQQRIPKNDLEAFTMGAESVR